MTKKIFGWRLFKKAWGGVGNAGSLATQDLFLLRELFKRKQLPVIYQTEAAECGLASLAMVINFYGHKIDLTTLRRKFSISLKGASLKTIIDIAEKLDFATRPLRVELESIGEVRTPAILHWEMDHFVVLKKVTPQGIFIHDPARGERRLSREEFSKFFTGVVLEVTPTNSFSKKKEINNLKLWELWSKSLGLKSTLLQIVVLTIILQLFALATPFYSQLVIDEVIGKYDLDFLNILALGFGAFTIVNVVTTVLRRYTLLYFGSMLSYQMTINLFRHLLKLPLDFFEKRNVGDILSRFGSVDPIKEFFKSGLISSVIDGLMAVTTLIMMFVYNPMLTAVVIFVLGLYLGLRLIFYPIFREKNQDRIIATAKEKTNFIETLRGFMAIKLFSKEGDRQREWQHKYADVINTNVQLEKLNILFDSSKIFLFGMENIIIFYLAAQTVIAGDMTVGMLVAFMTYKVQFIERSTNLVKIIIDFRMLGLHLERLSDIAKSDVDNTLSLTGDGNQIQKADIEIRDLAFRYAESEPLVFRNIDLKIEAGSCIAITGPSGCGKTTLLKVMAGLFPPLTGEVLIDGIPLSKISKIEFRAKVGAVMQEDYLFAGNISDNICFFAAEVDQDLIQQSAKKAAIHEEIMAMPMGYYSLVGDMGSVLSGGQKQRVLLARALYKNPQILMMDEGSSHLDVNTERKINQVIKQMKMTRIIVAHRSETIAMADTVYEFRKGRLIKVR